jgi:hypothetical protein
MKDKSEEEARLLIILENHPYLTHGKMQNCDYLGVVQNCDNQMISIYLLDLLPSEMIRKVFLEYAEHWWNNSNRTTPINMFIKDPAFRSFRMCLRHFSSKEFEVISGPQVCLAELIARRVRRKQVPLASSDEID